MPEYLSILREASVNSIYILLILVVLLLIFKGRIKEREFVILFYIWLPAAVFTQFLMTYYRLYFGQSNLPIMNIYLMFEFAIIVFVLLKVRLKVKGTKINYKLWTIIILVGVIIHFIYKMDTMHNAAMLYIAIVYFHLTVSFIDLNKVDEFLKDPYSFLHIAVFTQAFGYSYFLIYQTDYKFPLSIYSGLNLLVQILFAVTLFLYYKNQKNNNGNNLN